MSIAQAVSVSFFIVFFIGMISAYIFYRILENRSSYSYVWLKIDNDNPLCEFKIHTSTIKDMGLHKFKDKKASEIIELLKEYKKNEQDENVIIFIESLLFECRMNRDAIVDMV